MSETMSAVFPPMLSLILYLQFLQVQGKEVILSDDDALLKDQSLEFVNLNQSINIKDNVPANLDEPK